MPLAAALARAVASAAAELSTAFHVLALGGQVQGEAAGGGEAVERFAAAGVAGGGAVVLALVEEDAGLLAVQQVGAQRQAVHVHRRPFRESRPRPLTDSSGNCSLARTATSLRATMPRGWKISSRQEAISALAASMPWSSVCITR